jgi:hypothetical protein
MLKGNKFKTLFLTLIMAFTFSACEKKNTYIFFSSRPITAQTFRFETAEKVFAKGEKINFVVVTQEKFTNPVMRLQVLKIDDKLALYGYTLAHARDIEIDIEQNNFISDFYLHNAGYYMLRVFSKDNLDKPVAENNFWVKEKNDF